MSSWQFEIFSNAGVSHKIVDPRSNLHVTEYSWNLNFEKRIAEEESFSFLSLPWHDFLSTSREYPEWHAQTNDPGVLVHVCWHPPLSSSHSLMSGRKIEETVVTIFTQSNILSGWNIIVAGVFSTISSFRSVRLFYTPHARLICIIEF